MANHLETHFIFLIHGFMGNANELFYAEDAIRRAALTSNSDTNNNINVNIITHRVTCNNKKTFDGIEAGGKRVATEVQDFVSKYKKVHVNDDDTSGGLGGMFQASISFFGYSLGGMYARYAISVLPMDFEGIRLHPLSFTTAATPHLGMASHSFFILPRSLELLLGYSFGRTGRDLFRLHRGKKKGAMPNDIVFKMATEDAFLGPLSAFNRRVCYVNAFATDFMVPLATAGILSSHSSSRHFLSFDYDHWNNKEEIVFDVFAFETKPCGKSQGLQSSGTRSSKNDEALTMSSSLDSLGWTKVFVDCRNAMPGPSIRCICRHPRKDLLKNAVAEKEAALRSGDNEAIVFESKEICDLMKTSESWHVAPTGHFLLVAHSKTERGAKKFAKGRPLVDQAALELLSYLREFQDKMVGKTEDIASEQIKI